MFQDEQEANRYQHPRKDWIVDISIEHRYMLSACRIRCLTETYRLLHARFTEMQQDKIPFEFPCISLSS